MKKLSIFVLLFVLCACGDLSTQPLGNNLTETSVEKQPFVFEEIGDYIPGMLIDIEHLPSGNWLVATRAGHVLLLNWEFSIIAHTTLPTETFNDSGLFSMTLDSEFRTNRFVYIYRTIIDGERCIEVYCNALVRFTVEENELILIDPVEIAVFPMLNRHGYHQGGGMAFGPNHSIYLAVGDGSPNPNEIENVVQNFTTDYGKVHQINLNTFESKIVATGLRNPFTMISTPSGAVIADVGGEAWEELNFLPWGEEDFNYGWPLEEGPGNIFTPPLHSIKHCDASFQDADPYRTTKNHGGIDHDCENTTISVLGYWGGNIIYSEIYYGLVRSFNLDSKEDKHLAHFPGLSSCVLFEDIPHCVSLFGSNKVLRMVPNN